MSKITHVLIQGARQSDIDKLNEWLLENDEERQQQFQKIDMDAAGGTMFYVEDVWAAAFNYGPVGDLIPKLRDAATWEKPLLSVVVVIDGEEAVETFCFDGNERDGYKPVGGQEVRW